MLERQNIESVGDRIALWLKNDAPECDALALLTIGRQRGVEGLVADFLLRNGGPEAQSAAKEAFIRNFGQFGAYKRRFWEIEQKFEAHGIAGLALKGLPLSLTLYRERHGTRELSDIDLFVRQQNLDLVRNILTELGYELRSDTSMGYRCSGYYIDLHITLFDRIERCYFFEPEWVWTQTKPLPSPYKAMSTLEPHLNFCYLACHAMDHGFSSLKWIVDLLLLLPQCCGRKLKQTAIATNSRSTVTIALAAMESMFACKVPEEWKPNIEGMSKLERTFVTRIATNQLPAEAGKFFAVWNAKGLFSKLTILKRVAVVKGEKWDQRILRILRTIRQLVLP